MDVTYNKPSLFDYINNSSTSSGAMEALTEKSKQNSQLGLTYTTLNAGLDEGKIDATLNKIDSGELSLDSGILANYLEFNQQKLASQLSSLAENLSVENETSFLVDEEGLSIIEPSDKNQRLARYIDKDDNLRELISQTSKLSQLVEWEAAKTQAATLTENDVVEEKVQHFLLQAREVVNNTNTFTLSQDGFGFSSDGHTKRIIESTSEDTDDKSNQ